jgi:hypothetical protein
MSPQLCARCYGRPLLASLVGTFSAVRRIALIDCVKKPEWVTRVGSRNILVVEASPVAAMRDPAH